MAFLPYDKNMENMQINHINGVKGDDRIENLEWVTPSQNNKHARENGLNTVKKVEVQVRDHTTGKIFIFPSLSTAARYFNSDATTVKVRSKSAGNKVYDGYQFRFHPNSDEWPEVDTITGKFRVEFPNGEVKHTGCNEAARHAGVTRTSLLRMLREDRHESSNGVKVYKGNTRSPL